MYKDPTQQSYWGIPNGSVFYTLGQNHKYIVPSLKKLCLDKVQSLPASFYEKESIKRHNKKPYSTLFSLELDYGIDLERVLSSYENLVSKRPSYAYHMKPYSGNTYQVSFKKAPSFGEIDRMVALYTVCQDPAYQTFKEMHLPGKREPIQKSNKKRMCLVQ